ncbi:MAG: ankyrin repeat domain-containing protein [Candidatus Aminicenantes bacterium]|nr:ankyrin repeat domain-containing protein [Candidatus Aminicenantes bacterium]
MLVKTRLKSFLVTAIFLLIAVSAQAHEIFDSIRNNNFEEMKTLIEKDASLVNIKDEAGNTPLHHAVMIGSAELTEYLLSKGADINAQNTQLNTPLHEAIQNKKEDISALLIKKGADLTKTNIHQQTPLHKAASLNQKKTGEQLIAKGAAIDPADRWQRTPFLLVARHTGDVAFGKLLLDKGANINAKDGDNQMALNLAAWKGFKNFINFLLDNNAEYYSSPRESRWMLNHAAQCGSIRLFKMVLNKEKELLSDETFSKQIMITAIQGGSVDIVNLLLSKNIPLNKDTNVYGWTPSHYATRNGKEEMIRFLHEKGFDLNRRTLSGKSVYNIAQEYDQAEVMKAIKQMNADTGPARFPELSGAYLGQTPPQDNIQLFAPDIVSGAIGDDNHGSITFMPEGNEIYWNMWLNGKGKIWMTKLQNGIWTKPEIISFCRQDDYMYDNPFITADGKKMFFTSTRSGPGADLKENIWFAERTATGWSEPKPVSPEVNAMQLHWSISVSDNGTLYFGGTRADSYGREDIYTSKLLDGEYTKPQNMGSVINSEGNDFCPFIAPDESYIIFSRFGPGGGYYISFKDKSGNWLEPVKIHEQLEGVCPYVSPDGRYFFFNSDGIYWMPADFIEELKPKEKK